MKKYSITCIVQIYNELDKGNLKRFFRYVKPLVHEVVAYDDCSTDGSYEYSLAKTSHVIRGSQNNFANEISHRQAALTVALSLKPDFILWLDVDEVLSAKSKSELQELCREIVKRDIDGYDLHEINLWRSHTWARSDSLFNSGWFTRIWRVKEGMSFNEERGLHLRAVPNTVKRVIRTKKISVLHYGFSNDYNLASKYITYKNHGQRGYIMLDRLINEEKLVLKKVKESNFPIGLYEPNETPPTPRSFTSSLSMVEAYREKIRKPKYSIICLIYKDTNWLNFVYQQVIKYTHLSDCEFYFVANNATNDVKAYLSSNYIPHYIFEDAKKTKSEWYIDNVYRAWNFAASKAKGDFLVFINSDMAFSPNWLDNLVKSYNSQNCVSSRLIESGKLPSGLYGVSKFFGYTYKEYAETEFQNYAKSISTPETKNSGLFMPLLIRKNHFDKVGGYPEGNISQKSDIFNVKIAEEGESCISGDVVLMEKLKTIGIHHQTAFDSIVYHFQMGEMSSQSTKAKVGEPTIAICNDLITGTMGEKVLWDHLLTLPGTIGIDTRVVGFSNYESKTKNYISHKYKNVKIVIQNASYIHRIDESLYTIMLLQDNLRKMGRKNQIQEENLKFADKIITNSIQAVIDYPEYDMEYIPLGVDEYLFRPLNKRKMKSKHKLKYKKIGIFVGAFNNVKGFNEIEKIIKSRSDIFWILVTKLDEDYAADNVRVYKRVNQTLLAELLNCADFFILGSLVETQCLAAIEAALCNIPVVMHNVGIFQSLHSADLGKIGVIGDNLEDGIANIFVKNTFEPRKVMLKLGVSVNQGMSRLHSFFEIEMIKASQKYMNDSHAYKFQNIFRRKFSKIKYLVMGNNKIDRTFIGKTIIKYTPVFLYKTYRKFRYGKL